MTRIKQETSLNVMDNSIMSLQNMVILMSDRHPEKGLYLDNLAGALHARFKLLGNIKDLQDAISNQRKCLGITPDQDLNKPWLFSNLAGLLWDRFIHVGELEDLEEAIHGMQGAHRVLSDRYSGHPDSDGKLASSYANLGAVFLERHLRLRVFKDLEVAIQNLEMAVQLGSKVLNPDYRHIQSGFLTDLGTAFEARFDRLNALEDIDMAVSTQKQAAEILHDSDEKKQTRLSNLANALWKRFERLREPTDLESSIFYHLQAVQLTPDHNPSKPTSLNSLAGIFMERFGINGALEDLESAISNQEKAVQLTKAYDPTKTEHLMNLSEVLKERFKRLKDPKNLRDALSNAEQAANHPPGFPRPRFQAALIWAECAKLSSISPIPAFQLAINLLLRIAWLGIPITDQHALLAQLGDAVCDAVAAAINHYDYETAVEWAEQGRSIVWQNLLSLRTPLEILQVDHPKIAKQLQDISKQLETPSSSHHSIDVTQASPVSDIGQTYLHLSMERDGLIEKIRLIPGFETFLQAKKFSQLAPAAYKGPVVILNEESHQCDALVLKLADSHDKRVSVIHVPLRGFTSALSKKLFLDLKSVLAAGGVRDQTLRQSERVESPTGKDARFEEILRVLWLHVVKPVIDKLGYRVGIISSSCVVLIFFIRKSQQISPVYGGAQLAHFHSYRSTLRGSMVQGKREKNSQTMSFPHILPHLRPLSTNLHLYHQRICKFWLSQSLQSQTRYRRPRTR